MLQRQRGGGRAKKFPAFGFDPPRDDVRVAVQAFEALVRDCFGYTDLNLGCALLVLDWGFVCPRLVRGRMSGFVRELGRDLLALVVIDLVSVGFEPG